MTAAEAEPGTVRQFAPAKVNLTLHVTGQRADGYHTLDSLVVFADVGDWVQVRRSERMRFRVSGPQSAGVPTDDSNLVLRAVRLAGVTAAEITLEKHLPAAAGLGGGSSDAAAVLQALQISHGIRPVSSARALTLGADVPMCLVKDTVRVTGIGEELEPAPGIPQLPCVLINPGVPVHTPDVFRNLSRRDNAAMENLPGFADVAGCSDWLARQRNDLEPAAIALAPVIGDVLAALRDRDALLARMSGSGASCFGVFGTPDAARSAARQLADRQPGWWVRAATLAKPVQ